MSQNSQRLITTNGRTCRALFFLSFCSRSFLALSCPPTKMSAIFVHALKGARGLTGPLLGLLFLVLF